MKQSTELFNFESNEIKVMLDDKNQPWFIASEVCKSLLLENTSRAVSRVSDKDKSTITISNSRTNNPNRTVINEPGLYDLVMLSRTEQAKRFKEWITHEVLPSIRKTGSYALPTDPSEQAMMLAHELVAKGAEVKRLKNEVDDCDLTINMLSGFIEKDKPKVAYHDAVVASDKWQRLWDFGGGSGIGKKNIFKFCKELKYIYKNSDGTNQPYQRYVDQGWFDFKSILQKGDENWYTYVSGKGKSAILKAWNDRKQLKLEGN